MLVFLGSFTSVKNESKWMHVYNLAFHIFPKYVTSAWKWTNEHFTAFESEMRAHTIVCFLKGTEDHAGDDPIPRTTQANKKETNKEN